MRKIKLAIIFVLITLLGTALISSKEEFALSDKAKISYSTHVQNIGWQKQVSEGKMAGTTNKALRMEAIKINNSNSDFKISYQVHIQNIGWQDWRKSGEIAGTEGLGLRMEAIRIKLENTTSKIYNIEYRAHVQNIGWQDWVKNGEIAGTTGRSLRIEAIEIRIIEETDFGVIYTSHVQNIGWEDKYSYNGQMSGTEGLGLRDEAIKIELVNSPIDNASIRYNAYVENSGWSGWKQDGEIAGSTGKGLKLEALKIELVNLEDYSVKYRLHIQNVGWTAWKKDGEQIGKAKSGLRIEAVEIEVVKNGKSEVIENVISSVKKGIDVSEFQGTINWANVKRDGVKFAMIRAGFRGYGSKGTLVTDSCYYKNIQGALNNGIEVGVYFFTEAINEKEAVEEANYVLNLVKGYNITYPIAIDTEDISGADGRADNLSKQQRTAVVKAFCERIKEAGYEPMIYANKYWLKEQLDINQLSDYAIWLAHYTGATQNDPFAKPSSYEGKYIMWQYTSSATVRGIVGSVDGNVTTPDKSGLLDSKALGSSLNSGDVIDNNKQIKVFY